MYNFVTPEQSKGVQTHKYDPNWFIKCDASIRFNFGNYDPNISEDEWAMMWNQLVFIKEPAKKK